MEQELDELKTKKRKLENEIYGLEASADSLAEKAERTSKVEYISKSNEN